MSPPALPLRLPLSPRRRTEPAPAEAFLLPGGDGGAALAIVAGQGGEARIFEVSGGLLVVLGGGGRPGRRPPR
ncbi:hypothetical protein [Tautonia plasticadhaerens]|uniref:Uncharacterized protein n=1 Tax=Tautonia plasticadhaerens TaxID=2527974 RepID=A0A518H2M1_9BACT|nr:hypothetical protein [Tautonia plasticadhaerens]QDV35070.1 hypothetical protein ElP_29720 [Tautonia plasticadhaerens]